MIGILIPAHNEEALLDDCLRAARIAANHPGLLGEAVQILVVLDSCSDASAAIAQAHEVHCLHVQARNVGHARGVGAGYLLEQGARWISCTDADSRVAPDWLVAQLAQGCDAVCGTVTVDAWSDGFDPAESLEAFGGGFGAGYRGLDLILDTGQGIDKAVDGGACANTDNGVRLHIAQRGPTYGLFHFILSHFSLLLYSLGRIIAEMALKQQPGFYNGQCQRRLGVIISGSGTSQVSTGT